MQHCVLSTAIAPPVWLGRLTPSDTAGSCQQLSAYL
jgi:hypothetical protein